MPALRKILIANRGEIAARIIKTCFAMGIETVAVYSDADADAPFVKAADEAFHIGAAPSAESYLVIEKIIDVAEQCGADAIHPGYGFLAENATFASRCRESGLTFIGPSADVIRLLGSKKESKDTVGKAGVPVIPGYNGADQKKDTLIAEAKKIGFPVLLKASAGGGGKGMRVVRAASELEASIDAAKRESKNAFGDDLLLIEKYIENPRHIEIQILGDSHGSIVHLFERECSIQRRHQKIIEESPSPALDDELRAKMGATAVLVGKTVSYENAGTVEFILSPTGEFFFLEVNTRLQVEHPVTESITGLDLVKEQIRIAGGEALGYGQEDLQSSGAAIECRIYAEDPDNGFLPTSGPILDFHVPTILGLRMDSGIESGSEASIHYDPMLAKIITHGSDRAEAIRKMTHALKRLSLQGIKNNCAFLLRILENNVFLSGEIHTHFIADHGDSLKAKQPSRDHQCGAIIAATLYGHEKRQQARKNLPSLSTGYRNNRFSGESIQFYSEEKPLGATYTNQGDGRFSFDLHFGDSNVHEQVSLIRVADKEVIFQRENGRRCTLRVIHHGYDYYIHSLAGSIHLCEEERFPQREAEKVLGGYLAPMPGKVSQLLVQEGSSVHEGDTLIIMEAMKMEMPICASEDGVVTELRVEIGEQVDAEAVLLVVSPASSH